MRWLAISMQFAVAALMLLGASRAFAETAVTGVRVGAQAERTRVVLELTGPVEFTLFSLADPYRVVLDFPQVAWRAPMDGALQRGGVVSGLRYGQFRPGTSRLVLDLAGPAVVQGTSALPPSGEFGHRLLIDLAPADRPAFLAAVGAGRPPPEAAPAAAAPKKRQEARRVIVLDPGHGGVDPGTIGVSGVYEKDLVLEYALELRRRLEATRRYRVVMTREDDVFLSLPERVRIAQQAAGDLFISIHADSIENGQMRGGAVYTLAETSSDAEAERLAAKENRADLIAGLQLDRHDTEVVSILISLAQRETMNYSARFANVLVPELQRHKVAVRRKPHRFAGFRVLKAPDVPSVLLELGYLSNPKEERHLRSPEGRATVTAALVGAIDRYFADLKL
jgi:N-acetylmuramoyl-L-alanine amidase